MRYCAEFLLTLIYELQDQVASTDSFIFISDLTDISMVFKEKQPQQAVQMAPTQIAGADRGAGLVQQGQGRQFGGRALARRRLAAVDQQPARQDVLRLAGAHQGAEVGGRELDHVDALGGGLDGEVASGPQSFSMRWMVRLGGGAPATMTRVRSRPGMAPSHVAAAVR